MRSAAFLVAFMFCLTSGPVADARPEKVDWSQYLETKSDRPVAKASPAKKKVAKAKPKKGKAKAKKAKTAARKKRR